MDRRFALFDRPGLAGLALAEAIVTPSEERALIASIDGPQLFSDIPSACQMNTRPHCRTSPPIRIGGQPMPGGITTNSRTGFAASRPNAGFRIPSASCWISPGATMPEPIGSAAAPQTDDRRSARMGLVGDGRVAGVRNVAADHQALAPSAPSPSRRRSRRFVMRLGGLPWGGAPC
jgi:hypothetical protein